VPLRKSPHEINPKFKNEDSVMKGISRRDFLNRTARLTSALAATGAAPRWAWSDPLGLPIGIQLYTVGADIQADAPAAVRKIASIGYKEVETEGFGSLKTAAEFRKVLDDNGLRCPSAHLQFDLSKLQKAFDDANALGCKYATASVARQLLQSPGDTMAPMTEEDSKRLVDLMNILGSAAKKSGLVFASHNHTEQFSPVLGKTAFDYLVNHTDPETVAFEVDCGWASVAGVDPGELVKAHPGRVKMLHVKDFFEFEKGARAGGPNSPKGAEIGAGVIDYKKIFAEMKGKGIEHSFVEQEGPFSRMPAMQAAKADYAYLHSIF
jgi:sugar phosphate isomerase/epimerase